MDITTFNPIILYGPPGVGKSSIIKLAQQRGIESIDIEKLGHSYEERKTEMLKVFKQLSSGLVICGAADMKQADFPVNTRSVLLLPDNETYERRLEHRNDEYPHKDGQEALMHYHHIKQKKDQYDLVLEGEASAEHTLDLILNHFTLL